MVEGVKTSLWVFVILTNSLLKSTAEKKTIFSQNYIREVSVDSSLYLALNLYKDKKSLLKVHYG